MDTYRDPASDEKASPVAGASLPVFRPTPLSLRVRLLVLVAGTLLPMLVLLGGVVYQSYQGAKAAAAQQVLQVARAAMFAVDLELENQIAALEVLALEPAIQADDLEAFRPAADRFLTRFPAGTAVSLSARDGRQVFITNTPAGAPVRVRTDIETIEAVFRDAKPQVSDIYVSRISGRPTFTVDVPVTRDGVVIYDLAFNSPRGHYHDILTGLDLAPGWVAGIFDGKYQHIARRPPLSEDVITGAGPNLREALRVGVDRTAETVSLEGKPILAAFAYSQATDWVVGVSVPIALFEAPSLRALVTAVAIGAAFLLVGAFFAVRIATQLVRAEGHRELLVNELNHRVKNTLSSVQAIVWRGLRNAGAEAEARQGIDSRLQALSSAHNILSRKSWEGARFEDIVASIVDPYAGAHGGRVRLQGPDIAITPRVAIALALILNELATNAVKYGALTATTAGIVTLSWTLKAGDCLVMEWVETGGPRVSPPARSGYGTQFIQRAVVGELGGSYEADFRPEGLRCVIEITL